MTKRKKNPYQVMFYLVCAMPFLVGIWQAKEREDLRNKVSALNAEVSDLHQIYEKKYEESIDLEIDKLALQDDLNNMKHYAWKLEKVIERISREKKK